eukprot:8110707-Alexandrium_andersonii.AAC.1
MPTLRRRLPFKTMPIQGRGLLPGGGLPGAAAHWLTRVVDMYAPRKASSRDPGRCVAPWAFRDSP